jgi:hypothetical protein
MRSKAWPSLGEDGLSRQALAGPKLAVEDHRLDAADGGGCQGDVVRLSSWRTESPPDIGLLRGLNLKD